MHAAPRCTAYISGPPSSDIIVMLPLPLIEEPAVGRGGFQRRRRGAARAAVGIANGALTALKSLLGFESQPGPSRCGVHNAVRAEVVERVCYFKPDGPNAIASDEAALRELLKGRSVYDVSRPGCSVKPHGSGPVALSTDLTDCPNLSDALPAADRLYLEGNHERMRNRIQQLDAPIAKPYVDDVLLRTDQRTYVKVARQCLQFGLVRITEGCKSEVGLFLCPRNEKWLIAFDHQRQTT